MERIHRIEISHRTIIFTVFFLIFLWLVYQLRGVILLIFISMIIMSALNPAVNYLQQKKIPRAVAILFFYILIIAFISSTVASLIPPLVEQTTNLINSTPKLLERLEIFNLEPRIIVNQLSSLPQSVFHFALSAVSNVIIVFTVLVFTFYLLLERHNLKHHLTIAFGDDGEQKAEVFIDRLEARLGRWVRGQLFSMFLVGFFTYSGLSLLGISFALPLAILAGILELIPNIGPTLSAIPAIMIAFSTSSAFALGVGALYFVIQQVEAQIITPNVMHRAVGFNPLVTIIALLSGFSLAGIAGAILSIPVILVGQIVLETIYDNRKNNS